MMMSYFDIYDPSIYLNNYNWLHFNWLILVFITFFMSFSYFCGMSNWWALFIYGSMIVYSSKNRLIGMILGNFYTKFSKKRIFPSLKSYTHLYAFMDGGLSLFCVAFFFNLLILNFTGILSYVFPSSAHLVLSISLGVPLWAGLMIFCWTYIYYQSLLHLVPVGCPFSLIFMLVIIEMIGYFIRPLALCVRLMANIVAGHLLMSLLGDMSVSFLLLQSFLFWFEFAVGFIQAYVFCILLYMYWWEI